jgi:hypothetical protein
MKDDARRDPAFSLSVDLLPPGGISVGNRARLTASPTDSMSRTPKSIVITSLLTLALAGFACGGDSAGSPSADLPDRNVFVATYEARVQTLSSHAVTEEQLLAFVEYHGGDLTFMRDLWNEVELSLDAQRPGLEDGR